MRNDAIVNIKLNVRYGFYEKLMIFLLPFFLRTVIIYVFGAHYLGVNGLFTSILQVLNVGELGFSSAITFCLYEPIAKNDIDKINRLLFFYRKIYRNIGISILFLGLGIMPFLTRLINGSIPSDLNLYYLYLLYLINSVIGYFFFAYRQALLSAYQKEYIISKINLVVQFLGYMGQIAIIIYIKNFYLFVICGIVTTILRNLLLYYYTTRFFSFLIIKEDINCMERRKIVTKVKGLIIGKLSGVSRNGIDTIFISTYIGLTETAIYGNYYYIMAGVISILNIFMNSIVASVGNSLVLESKEKNYNDMMKCDFWYMWISMWATCCMLCLIQIFVRHVWGSKMLFPDYLALIFCIYFYSLQNGNVRYVYATAKGIWWENRYRDIGETLINLVLSFILVQYYGVLGIIIATLISNFFMGFIVAAFILYKYCFEGYSIKEYFIQHIKYWGATMLCCAITYFCCKMLSVNNDVIKMICVFIICCILPNFIYFLLFAKSSYCKCLIDYLNEKSLMYSD